MYALNQFQRLFQARQNLVNRNESVKTHIVTIIMAIYGFIRIFNKQLLCQLSKPGSGAYMFSSIRHNLLLKTTILRIVQVLTQFCRIVAQNQAFVRA